MDLIGWLHSVPPITRTWFGLSLAVHAGVTLELLNPSDLFFDANKIFPPKLELWRIATCFFYMGAPLYDTYVLISLFILQGQSSHYERNPHPAGYASTPRADYVFCLLVCMTVTILLFCLLDTIVYHYVGHPQHYLYPIFTNTLVTAITYLEAKRNPNARVQFLVIDMEGRYVPFCHIAMALAVNRPIAPLVHGMLAGHIYYYLVVVWPSLRGGRYLIETPSILIQIVNDIYGHQEEYRQREVQEQPRTNQGTSQNIRAMTYHFQQQDGATTAHVAAKLGRLAQLEELSRTAEGRTSFAAPDNNQWQPLHEAIRGGHLDVINYLVGFDTVDINCGGREPNPLELSISTHGPNHPVTRRLRELGAVSNDQG